MSDHTFINVPYKEKDEVKTFGACWKYGEFSDVFCFAASGFIEDGEPTY